MSEPNSEPIGMLAVELLQLCKDLAEFLKPRSGEIDLRRGGDASAFHRDLIAIIKKAEAAKKQ